MESCFFLFLKFEIFSCDIVDLRENEKEKQKINEKGIEMITFEEGCLLAQEVGAYSYVETSALNSIVNNFLLSF